MDFCFFANLFWSFFHALFSPLPPFYVMQFCCLLSSPCISRITKLSLTIKAEDVISSPKHLFLMQNISFHSLGSCRKKMVKIRVVFGFKSDRVVLTSTFWFLLSQFFRFSFLFFVVLFAEHLLDYSWVGKVLGNAFRIFLGLDERNLRLRWVVRYVLHANSQVDVTWCVAYFFDLLDWIVLILV